MTEVLVPRDAATVMIVRDGDDGIEVIMVCRTQKAAFAPGVFVFPGGAVDATDAEGAAARMTGRDEDGAGAPLDLWFAACREAFEEAGIVIGAAERPPDAAQARLRVADGSVSYADWLDSHGLTLDISRMAYVARWVTPIGETRRFDTRFFLVEAPPGQEPVHDASETTEALWVHPRTALEQHLSGENRMLPPTLANLGWLDTFTGVDEAVAAGLARTVEPVSPEIKRDPDGMVRLVIGGDMPDVHLGRGR